MIKKVRQQKYVKGLGWYFKSQIHYQKVFMKIFLTPSKFIIFQKIKYLT